MKRTSYVDSQGNPIDQTFESKKGLLRFFFVVGTIVPLVIVGFIIYVVVDNNGCNDLYKTFKNATNEYLKDNDLLPTVEGEDVTVSVDKLYKGKQLSALRTNNMECSGSIKTTKYKNEYIYTLNLTNCGSCTVSTRYNGWSAETSVYPSGKSNIDVIPYYNYYQRQVNTTAWSEYLEPDKLKNKKSKYGFALPIEEDKMPELPEEGNIVEVQKDEALQYRYTDKRWRWYDIVGDYSAFSSEQPTGYANRDENSSQYTEWSEYSLEYPEEKDYREITSTTGYIFYYEEDGKKVYANHQNYTASDDVDRTKYDKRENQTSKMYRYRDKQWRWYNGQKRRYSNLLSTQPNTFNYRDDDTMTETSYSSWSYDSKLTASNSGYRTEETRTMTRFRYVYEILSAPIYEKPVTKKEFTQDVEMTVPEFSVLEEYKLEVSYRFKYQKR